MVFIDRSLPPHLYVPGYLPISLFCLKPLSEWQTSDACDVSSLASHRTVRASISPHLFLWFTGIHQQRQQQQQQQFQIKPHLQLQPGVTDRERSLMPHLPCVISYLLLCNTQWPRGVSFILREHKKANQQYVSVCTARMIRLHGFNHTTDFMKNFWKHKI